MDAHANQHFYPSRSRRGTDITSDLGFLFFAVAVVDRDKD
jgi:hypothetical protein